MKTTHPVYYLILKIIVNNLKERFKANRSSELEICSPSEKDFLGRNDWKDYLDPDRLEIAWSPPENSPYQGFYKTLTIQNLPILGNTILPRHGSAETFCFENAPPYDDQISYTLMLLDTGSAHSVALGAAAALRGFQPIIMFNNTLNSKGKVRTEQGLASMLYYARLIETLKLNGRVTKDSPPAFVLDLHRQDYILPHESKTIDNTYFHPVEDFPDASHLCNLGINRILYVRECRNQAVKSLGYGRSNILPAGDLENLVRSWRKVNQDIKIEYYGIDPWFNYAMNLGNYM